MKVHQLKEIRAERGVHYGTAACGVVAKSKSRADVFAEMTAWHVLTTCPECLNRSWQDRVAPKGGE